MIRELKEFVLESSEDEVKSLLFQMLLRISIEEQNEQDLAKDLKKFYRDFLIFKQEQNKLENEKDYQAVHVVFGDSSSGSLKLALKDMEEEKVICLSDNFSIGPIWKLEEEEGLAQRHKWLMNHINIDEDYLFKYQYVFKNTLLQIHAIPEHVRIIIWAGENSDEQTALRYVLYLLKDRANNIIFINTTTNYNKYFTKTNLALPPKHTGEVASDKLRKIYERNRSSQPLSQEERKKYEHDWLTLSNDRDNLRVWENKRICNVDEDYYDDYIIHTAKRLHVERNFLKSARLIGEIIGHLNQAIGDQYFDYRLIHLILQGVFEIEGVPKAMRFYSVKLRKDSELD
ncbi:DUF1835 domain-containing protein [Lysinibacillus cavernae]|uniref:DUF1835 domain-containing protein n=1 Tax=Lysinibacillus cavernae TaxID=2666135 RepID=UPI0012D8A2FE|nr:DUF1835 domain-containing protein [Lysinibacillus cavernae]